MSVATQKAPTAAEQLLSLDENDESNTHDHCLICYDTLEYKTLQPCDHNDICPVCMLRLRHLHKDKHCPICKQEHEQVIVEEAAIQQHQSFAEYPIWGNELGSDFLYKESVGMFFRSDHDYFANVIQPLLGFACLECDNYKGKHEVVDANNKSALRGLQDHLRKVHRLQLCNLCVDNNRDFVTQLPRFTASLIHTHLERGDPGTAFKGHPVCEFCRPKRFYDITQLHFHLNQEHYKCHVCDQQGLPNQFFKNYKSLERHFDNQHFLCHDVGCMQARFVVFASELDLRHHERQVHGGTSTGSSKISLEFRYDRARSSSVGHQEVPSQSDFDYSLDGQAFVPDNLPQSLGRGTDTAGSGETVPDEVHPLHMQRTAQLRQLAAQVAQEQGLTPQQPEAFPSLAAAAVDAPDETPSSSTGLRAGWTSGTTISRLGRTSQPVGRVTEESFPSLGGGITKKKATSSASRNAVRHSSTTSTFAAIQQATNPPATSWRGGSVSAARPTTSSRQSPYISAADQFPSLGGGSSNGPSPQRQYAAAQALARQNRQSVPPQFNDSSHFPPPQASSAAASQKIIRNRVLGDTFSYRPATATTNILQAPPLASTLSGTSALDAQSTIEDLKVSLGKPKYKQLKQRTAEFADGTMPGDAYVDHVASLFEGGYGDKDFWKSVPALIESCPASDLEKNNALLYMDNLKRMKNGAMNAESIRKAKPAPKKNSWDDQRPPSSNDSWPAMRNESVSVGSTSRPSAPNAAANILARSTSNANTQQATNFIVPGKKKGAWGGANGASTVARAKAPPGSVAAAAANSGQPQKKTGTKFMAQEQKKLSANSAGGGGSKKKKNGKKNDELRQLAFGGS